MRKSTIILWAKILIGLIIAIGVLLGYYYYQKNKELPYTNKETIFKNQPKEKNNQEIKISQNALKQWACSASVSSSYGTPEEENWSEKKLIGEPDVTKYGDCENAWAPGEENKGEEWIELEYQTHVYATAVKIYQSYNPGAVTKLEVKDEKGEYHTIWTGDDETSGLGSLDITFPKINFKTNIIKITLDTKKIPGWNEIDAVELVGIP